MSESREISLSLGTLVLACCIAVSQCSQAKSLKTIAAAVKRDSDTRRMAETAETGSVRSTGGAVPEGESPND